MMRWSLLGRLSACAFLLAMLASGLISPTGSLAQDATPVPAPAVSWSVSGISEARFIQRKGAIAYPSPDGHYVAFATPSQLCLDDLQLASEVRCADLTGNGVSAIDEYGIAWSHAGDVLYFTDRWAGGPPLGLESDLWQWDPFSGALENLSDDGVSGSLGPIISGGADRFTLDARPAPLADGSGVIVSRSTWSAGAWTTQIVSLPSRAVIGDLVDASPSLFIPDAVIAVGDNAALVGLSGAVGEVEAGLTLIDAEGAAQLLTAEPGSTVLPLSVDASGSTALIVTLNPSSPSAQGQIAYSLLDIASGEQTDLIAAATRDLPGGGPKGAALSPDGEFAALAWSTTSDGPVDLYITDVASGTQSLVVEDVPATGDAFTGRGAWWNNDGSISLIAGDGEVARVSLASEVFPTPTPGATSTPTPEPTITPTPEPTQTPTPTPTIAPRATSTPSPEPTASPTPEPTSTPTPEPTATPSPAPTSTPTSEPTATPSPEPTSTPASTSTPTPEPTSTPSPEPTSAPEPTSTPAPEPTATPTSAPTLIPIITATTTPQPRTSPESSPVVEPTPSPAASPITEASPAATPEPTVAPTPAGLELENGEYKPFPGAVPGLMLASPDGRQVAIVSSDRLCVYRVTTGQRRACVDVEGSNIVAIDPNSVTWSPDSKYVAFSEAFDATDESVESDIWRFDPDVKDVVDLTADQMVGPIGDLQAAGETFSADTGPAWSPDGSQIYFQRSIWSGSAWTTVIMGMAADGSGVFQVVKVDDGAAGAVPSGTLVVTSDGFVIFTRDRGDPSDPGNGIWSVSIAGNTIDQLFAPPAGSAAVPRLASISPDGSSFLLVLIPGGNDGGTPVPTFGLVDRETGTVSLIVREGSRDALNGRAVAAAYAPDGNSIVYLWESAPGAPRELIRRSLVNGSELVVASGIPASAASPNGVGISWAAGGPLIVSAGDADPAVLRIPSGDVPEPQIED